MSKINKSHMTVDGKMVHLSMPFSKVDEKKRLVSGFATLDNIDSEGDVVLSEASANAFARARGNIREMHQPIAVGKMVDFREDEFYDSDADNGKGAFYRGIFVTARVSEGAEDTWKKVLDGTLTGFSIGGEIREASNEFVKEAGRTIRFIKEYDLVELSLVDNPANQLANIFSIEKADNGAMFVKGMVAETKIETVFICNKCDFILVNEDETATCPECTTLMENAGWFESNSDREEKVRGIVSKFRGAAEQEVAPISPSEGGVEMSTKVTKSEGVAEEKETSVPNPSETHPDGEKIEEEAEAAVDVEDVEGDEDAAESPDEVEDEELEISKKIDELHDAVKESLEKTRTETSEQVTALEKKIDEATEQFLSKASELESKMGEFGEKLETSKSRLAAMESRIEKMNSSEAIRKSVDVESTVENVQKNEFWGGAFSN